ncbi:hypothetical protein ABPG77_008572 [Micractinium sp. CCAP 211/92]
MPITCDLCGPDIAYEGHKLALPNQDAAEKIKVCGCPKPRHRHCINTAALEALTEQRADWASCTICKQTFNLDDRTKAFLQGAASQAPELQRVRGNIHELYKNSFELQEELAFTVDQAIKWRTLSLCMGAALAAAAVGVLAVKARAAWAVRG